MADKWNYGYYFLREARSLMRLFDKKLSILLSVFCLPLIFLPKINLIHFMGETAGLRVDDFVLAFVCVVVFIALYALRKKLLAIELWVGALVAFSLFSFVVNQLLVEMDVLHLRSKIFYCLRLLEYFLFFYVGAHLVQFFKLRKVICVFLLWNLCIMLLQKFDIMGGFSSEGYSTMISYRITGVASFPSEMGAVLNLVFCALVFDRVRQGETLRGAALPYLLFLLCALFIVFTGARIAILALLLAMVVKVYQEVKTGKPLKLLMAGICLMLCLAVVPYVIVKTASVFERSAHLFSWNNIRLIGKVWQDVDHIKDPLFLDSLKEGSYDLSWWIRIHKWCFAVKTYVTHPQCWLQGLGPGFTAAALDGGFVRIVTEYGIIGCFIFWKFFSALWRQSTQLKWMVIALGVNMIFFDTFLAYKPMSLLFLVAGYSYARESEVQKADTEQLQSGVDEGNVSQAAIHA